MIPSNNQTELINKLKYCIQNIERVDEMKNNAYKSVSDNLTWDAYGERYINFLNNI